MRFVSSITLLSILVSSSLAAGGDHISKGPAVKVGKGKAWTWVKTVDGNPVATGVSFTDKAIEGLPTDLPMPNMPGMPGMMPSQEWVLQLPKEVHGMPYDHIGFDWNPKGHDPMQIYGVPHFDVHFYLISEATQKAITAMGEDLARCSKRPDNLYVPATYINPPGTIVPQMGNHWIDPSTPELNGKPFTTTFIYGSYDGKTAFLEPMIALSFLQSKPQFSQDLKMPMAYDLDGYYPSRYSITYDEKHHTYSVTLENLAKYRAGVTITAAATTPDPTKLQIEDITEGTGPAAKDGDTVSVTYVGKLTDGTVFDSTEKEGGAPFNVTIGVTRVIKGWTQGLVGMKKGGVRRLTIPPDLAYGAKGYPGVIPPSATLIFDITLLDLKPGSR